MFLKKIFFVLFLFIFYQSQSQERILDFDVKVQIEKSGDIQVVENITIKAEGNVFKHGLLRVFPITRKDKDGNQIDVKYTISTIKKNGITEKYFTEEKGNDFKIYIGDKDVELETGIYQYQISYNVPFQIGYFKQYDELYWNVTGNGWDFSIDKATCQLYLPSENDKFENSHCYTGLAGSTASNCIGSFSSNNSSVIFSASNLGKNEGLTVAASFAKGIVNPPTFTQKSISYYKQIKTYLWSVVFTIGMFIFFFFNWRKHGKDQVKKTIIPEFSPPFDWSPVVVGYVYCRKIKDKIYMASLINIAVKGAIKIYSVIEKGRMFTNKKKYEIEMLNKDLKTLSDEESRLISSFLQKNKVKVEDSNYKIFDRAYFKWIESVINQINLKDYYQNNTRKKRIGFAILLIAGLTYELLSKDKGHINYGFYIGSIVLLIGLTYWFSKKIKSTGLLVLLWILAFFIFTTAVAIFLMTLIFLSAIQLIVIGTVILMYIFYISNLGKFTEKGAEAFDRLQGFKLYLETAEKNRMNMLNPPELTPQLFEKLFPYAIALGVEIEWGKQFEEVLEQAKYNPDWYQGDDDNFYRSPTMFLSSFGSSVNAAETNPSSSSTSSGSSGNWSSGSSGGGSSGGGGGGGGGGGW